VVGENKVLPNDQEPDPVCVERSYRPFKRVLPLDEDGKIALQDFAQIINDFLCQAAAFVYQSPAPLQSSERNYQRSSFF